MKKTAKVYIIGHPNSGKSTLLNNLIGTKISIVTKKIHTTRDNILGILNIHDTQILFVDTPGYLKEAKNALDDFLSEYQKIL